jgi:hypothetical protein
VLVSLVSLGGERSVNHFHYYDHSSSSLLSFLPSCHGSRAASHCVDDCLKKKGMSRV